MHADRVLAQHVDVARAVIVIPVGEIKFAKHVGSVETHSVTPTTEASSQGLECMPTYGRGSCIHEPI